MANMITEDYVSFETAKLLKEKGFRERVNHVYHYYTTAPFYQHHLRDFNGEDYENLKHEHYSAPTQAIAMKWLREVHKLIPIVLTGGDSQNSFYYWFRIDTVIEGKLKDAIYREDEKDYSSYEEAAEEAIKYCLEKLI